MKEAVLRVVKEGMRYYLCRLEIDWSRQTCCVVARSDEWLLTASKARFALLHLVEETRGMNPLVNDCLRVFDERGAVTKEDALYALVAMSEDEHLEWNVPNLLKEFLEKRGPINSN